MTVIIQNLPTGTLSLHAESAPDLVSEYMGFGARANLKRQFLFVSKVLGKHWPSRPLQMRAAHYALAEKLGNLESPVLFIGMAETAVGLGQGVFEAWLSLQTDQVNDQTNDQIDSEIDSEKKEAIFVHTTRYKVTDAEYLIFDEAHSHAPTQFLHLPKAPELLALFKRAKTLVLIDDEISTGNTFVNLSVVCDAFCDDLQSMHLVSLTDLSGELRSTLHARFSKPLLNHSLVQGSWSFKPNGAVISQADIAQLGFERTQNSPNDLLGRCGIGHSMEIAPHIISHVLNIINAPKKINGENTQCNTQSNPQKILFLGTGEFMHMAFLMASKIEKILSEQGLENNAFEVLVQSTTRSPILEWGDIHHKRSFLDNYGENITNYLYNVADHQYQHIFICHETPLNESLQSLALELKANLLFF